MSKSILIALVAVLGFLGLNAAFGCYVPKAALWINGIFVIAGVAAAGYVLLPASSRGNGMEDPYGAALLVLLIGGIVLAAYGAFGFGWAWWVLR